MLKICNRHKNYLLGILFTLLSFGAYAHSVAVFVEFSNGNDGGAVGDVRFNALTWHQSFEFNGRPSGSMFINSVKYDFVSVNALPYMGVMMVPGRLVASCNGYTNYIRTNYAFQTTRWIHGLNLCQTLSFNMTSYFLETPACNLSGSVNLSVPTVTAQPIISTTLCSGSDYSLSVSATGASLRYTWQVSTDGGANFQSITGNGYSGNTATLTYQGVSSTMNGYKYRCFIESTAGCSGVSNNTTTNNSTLTVNSGVNIASQPISASVCSGGNASFAVNAAGSSITYQWQLNNSNIVNSSNYSGATSPTLNITNVSSSLAGNYKCVMTSSSSCGGGSTNGNSTLTVTPVTSISGVSTYTNTICEGNPTPATLTVNATGSNLTYQWQVSTNGGTTFNNVSGSTYSGTTSSTLSISNAPSSLNGAKYRCLVSGACGPVQTSGQLLLIVNSKPIVTLSPVSKSVCSNGTTTFTAAANGTNPTFQWQVDGVNISNGGVYSGATTNSLTITNPDPSLNGKAYRVVVSSGASCGSPVTSTTGTLTVSSVPSITAQPISLTTICEGTNTTISVTATGDGLTYTWQDRPTGSGSFSNTLASASVSGVNSNILSFTSAPGSVAKDYMVQIAGTCGTTSSSIATLGVNLLPRVTASPLSLAVCTGSGATLSVTATGSGNTYQWQVSTSQTPAFTDIANSGPYSNSGTNILSITPTEILTGNLYRAKVSNSCATVYSAPATLTVNTTPNIAAQPVDLTLCEFTSGTISLTSAGNGIKYQWYGQTLTGTTWTPLTNSRTGGLDNYSVAGVTTNALRLSSVPYSKDGYKYLCEVSSSAGCGAGTISSTISTITVTQRPTITLQPINANNNTPNGNSIAYNFKTSAIGKLNADLNQVFTWYESVDGGQTYTPTTNLNGNNGNTYSVSNSTDNVTASSTLTLTMPASRSSQDKLKYLYRCLITGVCQNKTTNVVHVNPPPKIK